MAPDRDRLTPLSRPHPRVCACGGVGRPLALAVGIASFLADCNNGFCYQSFDSAIQREGDMMQVLDVLADQVGVIGVFSDWPATVTFYANCMDLK